VRCRGCVAGYALPAAARFGMLCRNAMTGPPRLADPLSLSAGALPRLGWAAAVAAGLWGAVAWAVAA